MIFKKKRLVIVLVIIIILIMLYPLKGKEYIFKMLYPIKYENYVETYSKEYNVDCYLIYAIIKAESNFNNEAVSSKEAKGLMQLMKSTAKDITKKLDLTLTDKEIEEKLLDPEFNIKLGTKYISLLIEKYKSVELAIVAYNAGSGNVDDWINNGTLKSDGSNIEDVPYNETNNYARKILNDYKVYVDLYK